MDIKTLFIKEAVFRLQEKREHLAKCFDQLDEEDMWSRPNPASNSVGNIVLHLCGNIGQYVLSSLTNSPDTRQRNAEFEAREGHDKQALRELLDTTIARAIEVVENCPEAELLRTRTVQGFEMDGLAVIFHAVEHLSYHTGQLAYLAKARHNKQLGFYDGFKLD